MTPLATRVGASTLRDSSVSALGSLQSCRVQHYDTCTCNLQSHFIALLTRPLAFYSEVARIYHQELSSARRLHQMAEAGKLKDVVLAARIVRPSSQHVSG